MKRKLQSGELIAWARKNSSVDAWIKVPNSAWRMLQISLPKGTAKDSCVRLFDIRVSAELAHALVPTNIKAAEAEDLGLVTPEEPKINVQEPPLPKRAKAGRPTNMVIILTELEHRIEACRLEVSLSMQAKALCNWFKLNHPKEKAIATRTIENKAGPLYKDGKMRCTNQFIG